MRLSNANDMYVAAQVLQGTPKSKKFKDSFKENLSWAPCSLKQQPKEEDDSNTEVLNICCSDFNSLLFLTPPKIRAGKDNMTPTPTKQDTTSETPLENAIPRDLMEILERDFKELDIVGPISTHSTALQNITNRDPDSMKTSEQDLSDKKKAGKSQFKFPDGGWVCLACQNYNFCGRVRCNRCGKGKTKDDPVGKPKHLLRKENDENDPSAAAKQPSKVKKQLKERAGDWLCLSCRNINFAFRQQCNRCKLGKELIGTAMDQKGQAWTGVVVYPQQFQQMVPAVGYCTPQYEYQGYPMVFPQGM